MITLSEYKNFNTSLKEKVVFRIGYDAGFFSEFNNMILTIHYCLVNKIQFILNSEKANFSYKNGWKDYFESFCEEDNFFLHRHYNSRLAEPFAGKKRDKIMLFFYKRYLKFKKIEFLTYHLLPKARKQEPNLTYNIPQINITSSLLDNCRNLVDLIWKYEPKTKAEIYNLISLVDLPSQFIGFHIRRGDKKKEVTPVPLNEYILAAEQNTSIRNVFVSTDDYTVFKDLQNNYKDWNFFTLTEEHENGYFQNEFDRKDKLIKRKELIRFFSAIELLSKAELCFGTHSSNIGMFLAMRMKKGQFIGLDFNDWKIW